MKKQTYSTSIRTISAIVLIFYGCGIFPLYAVNYELENGRRTLEFYLERATASGNEKEWDVLAQEGFEKAMTAWESANAYMAESDPSYNTAKNTAE